MQISHLLYFIFIITVCRGSPKYVNKNENEFEGSYKADLCKFSDCNCKSTEIPGGLNPEEIPQLVLLTFNDAVNSLNFELYQKSLFDRVNPDNCPIGATFYVSHEYTNYSMIHELWARGFEIGLHSISHKSSIGGYWKNMSVEGLHREFSDQLLQFDAFAKVPPSYIKGMRWDYTIVGNNSYQMMQESSLKIDSSCFSITASWPYTVSSFPEIWEMPLAHWTDNSGRECGVVSSCIDVPSNEDGIFEFMKRNFIRHYKKEKKHPFEFRVHSAWFYINPKRFSAYLRFIKYLLSLEDVYLVNSQRALEWVQNPSTLANLKNSWPSCQPTHKNQCYVNTDCLLRNQEGNSRILSKCGNECPKQYPEVGNPLGK